MLLMQADQMRGEFVARSAVRVAEYKQHALAAVIIQRNRVPL